MAFEFCTTPEIQSHDQKALYGIWILHKRKINISWRSSLQVLQFQPAPLCPSSWIKTREDHFSGNGTELLVPYGPLISPRKPSAGIKCAILGGHILRSPGLTAETTVLGLMPAPPETPGRWCLGCKDLQGWPLFLCGTWWFPEALKGVSDVGFWCGYGSIPINTIFSGMNIHLPAILGFTRYQGFDPSPCSRCRR